MSDQKTIEKLREAVSKANSPESLVEVSVADFCSLVETSGTESEGFLKAAAALKGCVEPQVVAVQAGQLGEMLDRMA